MKLTFTAMSGFSHWFSQRISAFLVLGVSLNLFLFNNIVLACLLILVVLAHGNLGIQTLIEDYTHSEVFTSYSMTSLHIASIIIAKTVLTSLLLLV